MRLFLSSVLVYVAATTAAIAALSQSSIADAATKPQMVERGAYLTTAGDCMSCHTGAGGKPFAGGLYMPTPFGELSTPNITPDKLTGIGEWSDDEFYRAMHEGIGRHNEYLYPVFPFPWFTKITRDDALAIKAYLFSLAPENAPRKPLKLGFPFNIRESLGVWRAAFFKSETFTPDPN
jgi:mono/diheme cytochrome c family protein